MSRLGVETTCRSCGAAIVWMMTAKAKRIPVDLERKDAESSAGEAVFDPAQHVSHFATCPDAAKWRK